MPSGGYCPLCFDHEHYGDDFCPRCVDHEHTWAPGNPPTTDSSCPGWWLIMAATVITATRTIKKTRSALRRSPG